MHTHLHGSFHGHVQGVTATHLLMHGHRLASYDASESPNVSILTDPTITKHEKETPTHVYFPGAALAVPLFAIAGVTALGLGAMGAW
ncbi:hypothetical protein [Ferroacidibacillus organovorans]|uniref:hypothetical protein n=1 Tax=Ferroacidibacillus organovorans TaxID=1765683 RepID=UPI001178541B|nr:hypothetical protein [Ferroacidibacillus organovorans]